MRKVYNFAAKYVRKSSICFEFVFTYIVVIEECSSSSTFRSYCFCQSGKKKLAWQLKTWCLMPIILSLDNTGILFDLDIVIFWFR